MQKEEKMILDVTDIFVVNYWPMLLAVLTIIVILITSILMYETKNSILKEAE